MAWQYGIWGQSNPVAATLTVLYTVPTGSALIGHITVANRSAVPTGFRIALARGGAADDPSQYIAYDAPIYGNQTIPFPNVAAGSGDVIRVSATAATLTFTLFGPQKS